MFKNVSHTAQLILNLFFYRNNPGSIHRLFY